MTDLQSVHGFRCDDNSAEREMSASACTRSMPGAVILNTTNLGLIQTQLCNGHMSHS